MGEGVHLVIQGGAMCVYTTGVIPCESTEPKISEKVGGMRQHLRANKAELEAF